MDAAAGQVGPPPDPRRINVCRVFWAAAGPGAGQFWPSADRWWADLAQGWASGDRKHGLSATASMGSGVGHFWPAGRRPRMGVARCPCFSTVKRQRTKRQGRSEGQKRAAPRWHTRPAIVAPLSYCQCGAPGGTPRLPGAPADRADRAPACTSPSDLGRERDGGRFPAAVCRADRAWIGPGSPRWIITGRKVPPSCWRRWARGWHRRQRARDGAARIALAAGAGGPRAPACRPSAVWR
jgi:hypothetical protein